MHSGEIQGFVPLEDVAHIRDGRSSDEFATYYKTPLNDGEHAIIIFPNAHAAYLKKYTEDFLRGRWMKLPSSLQQLMTDHTSDLQRLYLNSTRASIKTLQEIWGEKGGETPERIKNNVARIEERARGIEEEGVVVINLPQEIQGVGEARTFLNQVATDAVYELQFPALFGLSPEDQELLDELGSLTDEKLKVEFIKKSKEQPLDEVAFGLTDQDPQEIRRLSSRVRQTVTGLIGGFIANIDFEEAQRAMKRHELKHFLDNTGDDHRYERTKASFGSMVRLLNEQEERGRIAPDFSEAFGLNLTVRALEEAQAILYGIFPTLSLYGRQEEVLEKFFDAGVKVCEPELTFRMLSLVEGLMLYTDRRFGGKVSGYSRLLRWIDSPQSIDLKREPINPYLLSDLLILNGKDVFADPDNPNLRRVIPSGGIQNAVAGVEETLRRVENLTKDPAGYLKEQFSPQTMLALDNYLKTSRRELWEKLRSV